MGPDTIESTTWASSKEGTSTSIADTDAKSVTTTAEASTAEFSYKSRGHRRSFVVYGSADSSIWNKGVDNKSEGASLFPHCGRRREVSR